ncbi:Aminomethyltransferase folate-binding domain-containing protein [Dichomitus squalens]|uniref:Aminomethyltransferase folate-binding domain-containing protein n=1 Tax=Dichomitus squalens TaxID=114155 RepID=A0A4V2K1A7_9APHY|nr:Aminomethyltransferase folate-binding domain-containing protein [Dichomitus squalens]
MPLPPVLRSLVRSTPTVANIPHRAVISVTGSQAAEFLNGLTAASVPGHPQSHFYTAFLHAQGRVIHDIFIWAHTTPKGTPGYLIEYDGHPSEAPALLPMLKRHVLRSKVKLRDATEEYDIWQAWGSEREESWETERQWDFARSGVIEPRWDKGEEWPWGSSQGVLRDRRAVGMGHRLLVRKGDRPQETGGHDVVGPEVYLLHRILHGVPEGSIDIPPMQAFPMDSNMDVMGGLDFRKGCYVGQELTVRTYHTGQLRKRILPVVLHKPDTSLSSLDSLPQDIPTVLPETDIRPQLLQTGEDGAPRPRPRGTGKMLSATQGVGLALLRLDQVEAVEQGKAKLSLSSLAGHELAVTPYWPDWWPQQPLDSDSA